MTAHAAEELGPGTALSGFMKRISKDVQMLNVADITSLDQAARAYSSALAA